MLNAKQGTDEYNMAMAQAAEITHTLKEQTEYINATAMDFGQIVSNVNKALSGLVGGIQLVNASMNLFGIENEDVIKSNARTMSKCTVYLVPTFSLCQCG